MTIRFQVAFPIYCSAFSANGEVLVGGGGGPGNSGQRNAVYILDVSNCKEDSNYEVSDSLVSSKYELGTDEDAVMSITTYPKKDRKKKDIFVCSSNVFKKHPEGSYPNLNLRVVAFKGSFLKQEKAIETIVLDKGKDDYQKVTKFSPNGKYIVNGGTNGKLTVLKYSKLKTVFNLVQDDAKEVLDADFNQSSECLVAVTSGKCYAWSMLDKDVIFSIDSPLLSKRLPGTFRFSRFGRGNCAKYLYTFVNLQNKSRAYVTRWDTSTGVWKQTQTTNAATKPVTALDISKDGKWMAYSTSENNCIVMDPRSMQRMYSIQKMFSLPITAVQISPNSQYILTCSVSGHCRLDKIKGGGGGFPIFLVGFFLIILVSICVGYYLYGSNEAVLDFNLFSSHSDEL